MSNLSMIKNRVLPSKYRVPTETSCIAIDPTLLEATPPKKWKSAQVSPERIIPGSTDQRIASAINSRSILVLFSP